MYPLYWTKPVEGVFLCITVMNLKENVSSYIDKVFGQKHLTVLNKRSLETPYGDGCGLKIPVEQMRCVIKIKTKCGLQKKGIL